MLDVRGLHADDTVRTILSVAVSAAASVAAAIAVPTATTITASVAITYIGRPCTSAAAIAAATCVTTAVTTATRAELLLGQRQRLYARVQRVLRFHSCA